MLLLWSFPWTAGCNLWDFSRCGAREGIVYTQVLLHSSCLLARWLGLSTSGSGRKSARTDPMNQFLFQNYFLYFTFACSDPGESTSGSHNHTDALQPVPASPQNFTCILKLCSSQDGIFIWLFSFWQRRLFPLPLAWELEGTAGCSARAWCLCESRHELIRLAQQRAVIYEASPFLTFPLFMQCNFNVINTKRFTAERRELPSFISAIKLLVPTVAFPFNCLLGWNPGF